jgi:hypothetical protein
MHRILCLSTLAFAAGCNEAAAPPTVVDASPRAVEAAPFVVRKAADDLKSRDAKRRAKGAELLGNQGDQSRPYVGALRALAEGDLDPAVRQKAADALKRLEPTN